MGGLSGVGGGEGLGGGCFQGLFFRIFFRTAKTKREMVNLDREDNL